MNDTVALTEEQVERLRAIRDRIHQQALNPSPEQLYYLYDQMRLLLQELEPEDKT